VFIENFSIGLIYDPGDIKGTITLLRCNGQHGSTRYEHHNEFHIHRPTEKDLLENRSSESDIMITNDYTSFEQAVIFFATTCGIIDNCE
jgi:hypothetical protein